MYERRDAPMINVQCLACSSLAHHHFNELYNNTSADRTQWLYLVRLLARFWADR